MKKMKKLNLGCGKLARKGYVNLDIVKLLGVDVVHDMDKYPWPFKDNEFDYVFSENIMEHLSDIVKPMEELWRITKNKGKVKIIVPMYPSIWSMTDPTHKVFYTYITFNYFTPGDGLNYYTKARFKIIKRKICFHPYFKFLDYFINIHEKIQKIYYIFFSHIFPAMTLDVELEVVK